MLLRQLFSIISYSIFIYSVHLNYVFSLRKLSQAQANIILLINNKEGEILIKDVKALDGYFVPPPSTFLT